MSGASEPADRTVEKAVGVGRAPATSRPLPGRAVDVEVFRRESALLLEQGRAVDALSLAAALLSQQNWSIAQLQLAVDQLVRKHLGKTSERLSPQQIDLFIQASVSPQVAEADDAELSKLLEDDDEDKKEKAEAEEARKNPKPRTPHGRRPLPANLPRRRIEIAPDAKDCVCPTCNREKERIGEEISETLGREPARFYVNQHVRPKLACKHCEGNVSIAPVADKPIEGGLPEADLLAHVIVSKYNDHCPLQRLHRILLRDGVDVAVSTLDDWIRASDRILGPLVAVFVQMCLLSHVIQMDDTGIKVLDPKAPGGAKRGHLWAYVGDGRWAVFKYTPDWKGDHPQAFLRDREGVVQADAYKGIDAIFNAPGSKVIEAGCNAHARRYWVEALDGGDERAAIPLKIYQKLYRVERRAKKNGLTAEQLLHVRQTKSKPLMDAMNKWLIRHQSTDPPKSRFGRAVGYGLRQWKALCRFLDDAAISIDNTGAERVLRPVASGRKNYLFCGADAGGEWAATMYSILATCALNGVEPLAYLTDVIKKLASGWPSSRIEELLPPRWIEAHPEHRLKIPAPLPGERLRRPRRTRGSASASLPRSIVASPSPSQPS